MKRRRVLAARRFRAFSLVELLLVLAVIAVLAALLLPALDQARRRGKAAQCVNQLRQISLAFHAFAHDHESRFPMQVSTNAGGSLEFARAGQRLGSNFYFAFRHFQPLANELVEPKLLVCPADTRLPAPSFAELRNENISYFVGVGAELGRPASMLAGDRNVVFAGGGQPAIVRPAAGGALRWTAALHGSRGNVLFADGHVEQLASDGLNAALGRVPMTADALWLPVADPSSAVGAGELASGGGAGASPAAGIGAPAATGAGASPAPGAGGGSVASTGGSAASAPGGSAGSTSSATGAGGGGAAARAAASRPVTAAPVPTAPARARPVSEPTAAATSTTPGAKSPANEASSTLNAPPSVATTRPLAPPPPAMPAVTSQAAAVSNAFSQPTPQAAPSVGSAAGSFPRPSRPVPAPDAPAAPFEVGAPVPAPTTNTPDAAPLVTASSATAEPPPAEPDNWIGMIADFIVRPAAKATWLFLLLLLAVLITIEVVRRRRARRQDSPATQEDEPP
jgi:prepilin-type processing-associated H-X9-DG protein/prepilin-type N-terminal cleavage/methylation domain-containing protein